MSDEPVNPSSRLSGTQLISHIVQDVPLPTQGSGYDILSAIQDQWASSVTGRAPESDAVPPSELTVFSPAGMQWLQEKIGRPGLNSLMYQAEPSLGDDLGPLADALRRPPYQPLPPKHIALRLFKTYFTTINPLCPLFDEDDFMSRVEQQYPIQPQSSPAWWTCVNAVLALACMTEKEYTTTAWGYWKNSTIALDSFFLLPPQLLSAQALLAMTLFLYGNFDMKPSDTLLSMATRILHALDYTKGHLGTSVNLYKRILVVCYTQDIDIALRSGTPPAKKLDITALDGREVQDDLSSRDNHELASFNVFSSLCELTAIKSRVHQDLYSACAEGKSDTEVIATVGQLDEQLEGWRSAIPEDYRPGSNAVENMRNDPHLRVAYLHFSYYHCLLMIHRRAIPLATWQIELGSDHQHFRPSNSRTLLSREISVAAARATLDLVRYIPPENVLYPGVIASFVTFAMMTLSTLIVENPSIARAKADIDRMNGVDMFYYAVSISRSDPEVFGILEYCAHYRTLAERAIKRSLRSKMVLKPR
ncbi:hypothetical protein BJX96DRAFT_162701 [Aspergillus floccosus]